MSKVIRYLPEITDDEQLHIAQLITGMTEEQAEQFARVYRTRRKDPTVTLLTALLVFIGFGGINRFYLGQIGMGLLYFLTLGVCVIGSVVDMFNHKKLTARYNIEQAEEVAMMIRGAFPDAARALPNEPPALPPGREA